MVFQLDLGSIIQLLVRVMLKMIDICHFLRKSQLSHLFSFVNRFIPSLFFYSLWYRQYEGLYFYMLYHFSGSSTAFLPILCHSVCFWVSGQVVSMPQDKRILIVIFRCKPWSSLSLSVHCPLQFSFPFCSKKIVAKRSEQVFTGGTEFDLIFACCQ